MLETKTVTGQEQETNGIVRISQEGDQQGTNSEGVGGGQKPAGSFQEEWV